MTAFETEIATDQSDRAYVRVDNRYDIAIIRTDDGIELHVYPITNGEGWIDPLETFTIYEADIEAAEREMEVPQ